MLSRFLAILLASSALCFATVTTTVTVKPSGGDYTSLSAALSHFGVQSNNLVASDYVLIINIDGDWSGGPDTTGISRTFTTDSTHTMTIQALSAARSNGKWDTTKYILSTGTVNSLVLATSYLTISGIQIEMSGNATLRPIQDTAASGVLTVSHCLIQLNVSGTADNTAGIFFSGATTLQKNIYNNVIFYTGSSSGTSKYGIFHSAAGATMISYNNLIYGGTIGYFSGSGTFIAKNSASQTVTDGWSGTFTTSTNNCSDVASDAPAPGRVTGTITFVNAGAGDFHLGSADTVAKGAALDLSADSTLAFSDDISFLTRTAPWDIGPEKYVSSRIYQDGFFFPE